MRSFQIAPFEALYTEAVCALILHIQQLEFNVPITLADQPDLLTIPAVYQQNAGNFWVALVEGDVVGTIGLMDCGEGVGCIRKMFVRADWRGKDLGVAQQLLDTLEKRAISTHLQGLYLGTIARLEAAIRFYRRNGFEPIAQADLPHQFPRMTVDTHFFWKKLG